MDCNIRNIPEELIRRLKVEAASQGVTLRAHCIALLDTPIRQGKLPIRRQSAADPPPIRQAVDSTTHGSKGTCRVYRCSQCMAAGKSY